MLRSLVAVTVGLAVGANAFWRMECPGRVGLARIDPLVYEGELSPHIHAIHGSSGLTPTSDTSDLLAGDCTSCRVTQDKSAYWHPPLYFQDATTKKFELVPQVGGMLAYYLLNGDNVTAFPTNFRMLSGTNTRRTYTLGDPSKPDPEKSLWASLNETGQDTLAQRAIGFNCLNYDKPPEGTLYRHYLPEKDYLDANCKDGIRFEIMFPSCWKGGNEIDSPNHKDHVAFPDLVMNGDCPEGYPVRLPSMLYEIIWNTAAFKNRNGRFIIANGDPTGYGFHADFIMGWDQGFLQQAVDTCTNPSGRIEDCPLFNIVDQNKATQCQLQNVPPALLKEETVGPLDQLPGNVQISFVDGSDESGDGDRTSGSVSATLPTLTYKPGETASASGSPLPGQMSKKPSSAAVPSPTNSASSDAGVHAAGGPQPSSSSTSPSSSSTSSPSSVNTPPPSAITPAPDSTSASFFSTEYITNGHVVSKILWEEKVVYVTPAVVTTTVTVSVPAVKHRRHLYGHGHGHRKL